MPSRVRTYIEGFDDIIEGGLPGGEVIIVTGPAGSMKSSLTYYIIHRNALESGIKSLYVCLEEEKGMFLRNMGSLGMDTTATQKDIVIYDAGDRSFLEERGEQMEAVGWVDSKVAEPRFIRGLKYAVRKAREGAGIDLLVIDSLDTLIMLADLKDPREDIFRLFEWLREQSLTTIAIAETPAVHPALMRGEGQSEDFLADGIVQLRMDKINELTFRRYIRCVKMRATEHSMDYYILAYDNSRRMFEISKAL
jgi:KaiC/GvpD/RAD55 family RecA-like ATPase